jgi:hypothetical protein
MQNQTAESEEEDVTLNPETIETFTVFAVTLRKIHIRLITEGYTVTVNGIVPPKDIAAVPMRKKKT